MFRKFLLAGVAAITFLSPLAVTGAYAREHRRVEVEKKEVKKEFKEEKEKHHKNREHRDYREYRGYGEYRGHNRYERCHG